MDGVTILNTITENASNTAGLVVALIFSIVVIILSFIAIIAVSDKFSEFNGFVIAYIITGIVGISFLIVSILDLNTPQEPQTLYEVRKNTMIWVPRFPRACCCTALLVLAKPCWLRLWPVKQACPSLVFLALTLWKCLWAWVLPACATCLTKRKRALPALYSSMK